MPQCPLPSTQVQSTWAADGYIHDRHAIPDQWLQSQCLILLQALFLVSAASTLSDPHQQFRLNPQANICTVPRPRGIHKLEVEIPKQLLKCVSHRSIHVKIPVTTYFHKHLVQLHECHGPAETLILPVAPDQLRRPIHDCKL